MRKKEYALILVIFIALAGLGLYFISRGSNNKTPDLQNKPVENMGQPTAILGQTSISIEIANTEEACVQGLSGRPSLDRDKGILFAFNTTDKHCFWMKDMNFAIDILWIRDNGVVSQLAEKVTPASYPERFCPQEAGRYVLEVAEGVAAENGVRAGSTIQIVR